MKSRLIGWAILVVGTILAVKTSVNLVRLWKIGGSVEMSKKQLSEAEAHNTELKTRLSEVKSDQFAESEARNKLGYVKPGEELLIIPPQATSPKTQAINTLNRNETNLQMWWRLYISH